MVRNAIAAAAVVTMMAGTVGAQAPRPNEAEQVRARQQISMLEGIFERAVTNGADNLVSQVRRVMPDAAMLTGPAQVRGFRLDGHGVMFDVRMPGLILSPLLSLRTMMEPMRPLRANAALEELRTAMQSLSMSPEQRAQLMDALGRVESSVGVAPVQEQMATRSAGRVGVGAAALTPQPVTAAAAPGPAVMQAPSIDPFILDNPDEAYTREVKSALIEAMVLYGGSLALGPDEWLWVAARDDAPRDPLMLGGSVDFSTLIFRVKGSDLAAVQARQLSPEEARKRVEVREY